MSMTKGTPASSQIVWLESRVEKLEAKVERLKAALDDARQMLEWGARRMRGNCKGSDVDAMNLAAGRTAAALEERT